MADTPRRIHGRNEDLARLILAAGASNKSLAHQINRIAREAGRETRYGHTSVANWVNLGMIPRDPVPRFVAVALGERLGRTVTVEEIGMFDRHRGERDLGLDFPRDPSDAIRVAATYWRTVDRRKFLNNSFAVSAFTTPVTRWLTQPADAATARHTGRRVGRGDLDELWQAADEARLWDSKFGGGHWKSSSVTECLRLRAAPLLLGTYTEAIGKELFSATAELSRVVGWSAFDIGQHEAAQRHFVQALRLARAAGDVQSGCYVLTTMSLQTMLRGHPQQAADMAEGAYERAKNAAAPRVLAFAKLAEARAHGRAGDARAAGAALALSENLLDSIRPDSPDPDWLSYFTHARLAADATEIHHDLGQPRAAFAWNAQADAMPPGQFTRAVGIRLAVLAGSHLQDHDLDQSLTVGTRALDILRTVTSTRAHGYLTNFTTALEPWKTHRTVRDFVARARTELTAP
ncbi:sporulation protein [Streptomyces sp. NPDC012421]|uniref:sporulation protein n=1 Tax=Streptomyces sp. NPDC012421 TaxID=3364832 RepID=UPI0036EC4AB9